MDEEAVFAAVLEIEDADRRAAYLDVACGGNAELRRKFEELLASHDRAGGFLDKAAAAWQARLPDYAPPLPEEPGSVIGPYKLLEQISEGGFGVVFMAEQTEPIRRKVALKILKAGMDTRQVVARFEAERQALAMMEHPNIARVFDGGATASGRPYFVMELVKGVPITQYCDEHRLSPRQRLELFVPVCQAIQHAHQKGIIHRDLKPSNVLVARYDERPVPKVIDFGVAKAIGQPLTERTLHTGFSAVVGTLEYMSPEQASFNQLDIDTRSDVYSLAILLYELLTGTTPLDHRRAKETGLLEALRIIREEEAPTLSKRLSSTQELASIAARRDLEPAKLTKLVSGELDWIVMKALDKDRNRRYETANSLAADVQRYLSDEPVQACPPSAGYRLRKFARRNKGPVLAVTAMFLLLIAGIAGTTWGLVREAGQRQLAEAAAAAERAAKEAEAEQRGRAEESGRKAAREAAVAAAINDFLNTDLLQLSSALEQANHGLTPDANLTLRTVLQRAAKRIDGKFANEPDVQMKVRNTIAYALGRVGDHAGALAQYQKVAPYLHETLGPDNPETLLAELRVAGLHRLLGHKDIALPLLEQNLGKHRAALGPAHPQTHLSMNALAIAYGAYGRKDEALALAEEHLELCKRHRGPDHPITFVAMNNVAWLYQEDERLDKAVALYEKALAGMRKKLPPLHPERLNTTTSLARAYYLAEEIDRAVPLQESALPQYRTAYGVNEARTLYVLNLLIGYYVDAGWCDKAEALLDSTRSGGANHRTNANPGQDTREKRYRELMQRVRPAADTYRQELAAKKAGHPDTLAARQAFAVALRDHQRTTGAAYHLKAALDARQLQLGADHPDTQATRFELGATRLQQKRYAEAVPLLLQAVTGMREGTTLESSIGLAEGLLRQVQLFEGWAGKAKADDGRNKLDEQKKP
jgi:serine/threonine protein kinase